MFHGFPFLAFLDRFEAGDFIPSASARRQRSPALPAPNSWTWPWSSCGNTPARTEDASWCLWEAGMLYLNMFHAPLSYILIVPHPRHLSAFPASPKRRSNDMFLPMFFPWFALCFSQVSRWPPGRWAPGRQRRAGDVRTPGRLRAAGRARCYKVPGHHEFGASAPAWDPGARKDSLPFLIRHLEMNCWTINRWI